MAPAPEPIVLTDFAWRQLPPGRSPPNYAALGEVATSPQGQCTIHISNDGRKRELLSGATWASYARDAFSSAPLPADTAEALLASKRAIDAQRPLSRQLAMEVFEKYRSTYGLDPQPMVCDSTADPEVSMLVKGGLLAGGLRRLARGEEADMARAMHHLANVLASPGHIVVLFRSVQTVLDFIQDLHRRLMASQAETRDFPAGDWRQENVRLPNSTWCPPQHCELPSLMESFAEWACTAFQEMDAVHFGLELHCRLIYLHPFADGNGRIARILMNLVLLEAGYPPLVAARLDRNKFCAALDQAFWGNKKDYYATMCKFLRGSLDTYLSVLPSSKPQIPLQRQKNIWSLDSFDSVATSLHMPNICEPASYLNLSLNGCAGDLMGDLGSISRRQSSFLDAELLSRHPHGHPSIYGRSLGSHGNLSVPSTPGHFAADHFLGGPADHFLDLSASSPLSDDHSLQASPTLIPRPARGDTLGLLKRLVGDAASDRDALGRPGECLREGMLELAEGAAGSPAYLRA
eukprot:EG_transcript_2445